MPLTLSGGLVPMAWLSRPQGIRSRGLVRYQKMIDSGLSVAMFFQRSGAAEVWST